MTEIDFAGLDCWSAFLVGKACSAVLAGIDFVGVRVFEVVVRSGFLLFGHAGFLLWRCGSSGDFNSYLLT